MEAGSAAEFANGGTGRDWNAHVWAVGGTTATDINQTHTGSCVVLSSLAAATHQGHDLTDRFSYLGNFTYGVRLFDPVTGWVTERVAFDGTMVYNSGGWLLDPMPAAEGGRTRGSRG